MSRFAEAIAQFDALNAEDPNQVTVAGTQHPKELVYARRMSARLDVFHPAASEPLQLAARCQLLQRWKIPRSDYALGSMGYKKWRNALKRFHAQTATQVLEQVGYDATTIDAVQGLLKKRGLKSAPDVQALEDVVCLVFLEHYAVDFAGKHDEDKVIRILQKTWKKMSAAGHTAALALPLSPALKQLVQRAVSG